MATGSEGDDQIIAATSQPLTEETTATKRQRLTISTGTLTSRSPSFSSSVDSPSDSPDVPFDLVEEILSRLPVKSLLRFRCICESWKSIISNPKFAKKHLRMSTTRRLHMIINHNQSSKIILTSYPLDVVLTTTTTHAATQKLEYPDPPSSLYYIGGSCDGILCLADSHDQGLVLLWNPSIRKIMKLPPLEYPQPRFLDRTETAYGFGYDCLTDNYKVVSIFYHKHTSIDDVVWKSEVKVHNLGTNFWRRIEDFPSVFGVTYQRLGKLVSGKVNWLAIKRTSCTIVSLDLGNESYQEILQPDYKREINVFSLILGVSRDCLCILSNHDVWIMKEYGNKDSWTKLFTMPYLGKPGSYLFTNLVYILDDDQLLLEFVDVDVKLVVYDSRNGTFKFLPKMRYNREAEVIVESLISPYS